LQAERTWLAPAAIIAVLAGLVIITGLLATRTQTSSPVAEDTREEVRLGPEQTLLIDNIEDSSPDETPVTSRLPSVSSLLEITLIVPFDPAGNDQEEHPEKTDFINNDDASTGWYTERYTTSNFGNLKDGVGLIIKLGPPQHIDRLRISSPTINWSFEIFASQDSTGALHSWGQAIASRTDISGSLTVNLGGAPAATLLLWVTDLGKELPAGGHRVTITELQVFGRPLYG
tara:strand:- start:54 stop:743 length:690 start_codon:yes stop_codon:yes gene_type:complete